MTTKGIIAIIVIMFALYSIERKGYDNFFDKRDMLWFVILTIIVIIGVTITVSFHPFR